MWERFGNAGSVERKEGNARNLVSETDQEIERRLRAMISERFADHAIVGEEGISDWTEAQKKEFVWILDPIDGTTNYIQGIPYCCISIGVFRQGAPHVGVIYNPISDTLYASETGAGATKNGIPIHTSDTRELPAAFGSVGWDRDLAAGQELISSLISQARKLRVFGSHALSMCAVADGSCDFSSMQGPGLICGMSRRHSVSCQRRVG